MQIPMFFRHLRMTGVNRLIQCVGLLFTISAGTIMAQSKVVVQRNGDHFQLQRDGQPFFIKGVGGDSRLNLLVSLGGNSIRTWGSEGIEEVLDRANQHGLTVCVGMWLGHERHGFNYGDQQATEKQIADCLSTVQRYKDHPAVLLWGIGNEMEGEGNNEVIWKHVERIASEIKKIDPNHPTMTVIAELGSGSGKVAAVEKHCPSIDILGINSYGGILTVGKRYRDAGGTKPYIITEHGPLGPWEVEKTSWGSPVEITSNAKGDHYREGYRLAVQEQSDLCLGSYAFLWGHKQETTATWFGMLLPDGKQLAAVDAMSEAWTGKPRKNRCPTIRTLTPDRAGNLKPESKLTAKVTVDDPDRDGVTIHWVLRRDSATIGVGGDAQAAEQEMSDRIKVTKSSDNGSEVSVLLPKEPGGYRLFVYVDDAHGNAAVGNIPLHVADMRQRQPSPKAKLPFVVYGESTTNSPYVAAGYMGRTDAISMDEKCAENPHQGPHCLKINYNANDNWGGVLWQSPAGDWEGKVPGGLDFSGATALEFWARGAEGGETVNFVFGVIGGGELYRDTARGELKDLRLTGDWKKYKIPLDGLDLSRIKTGFGWSLAGQGKPVTFYLDGIRYVDENTR